MGKSLKANKKFPFTSLELAQSRVLVVLVSKYLLSGNVSEAKVAYKLLTAMNPSKERTRELDEIAYRLDEPALSTSWPEPLLRDLCRKAAAGDLEGCRTQLME